MKKIIIITAILVVVIVAGSIAASILLQPDKTVISGIYTEEVIGTGGTLEFKKDGSIIATYKSAGTVVYSLAGTYEIKEDVVVLSFGNQRPDNVFEGTFKFELAEDHIMFDGIKYRKIG